MALNPGDRIGPYEIVSPLGQGGMGEVYRALDTKLGRHVAIKVLPAMVAADPERLVRFEREAITLATLNHPHIAHVYGLEEGPAGSGHQRALVMELVEGQDLSRRLLKGAMPVTEALAIARQIADALDAAHLVGIVHRDLKPANIMLRPDGSIRVLDFGLAKVESTPGSPTMTGAGAILGTVAYMSPEQAKGQPVDRRCDIWAFGCVLYELLAGRPAFPGDSVAEVVAAVMDREPDWTALPAATPPGVRLLLRKCLRKDATSRLRDIGDARLDLEEASTSQASSGTTQATAFPSRRREYIAWAAAAAAVLAVAVLIFAPRPESRPPDVMRFTIAAPPGQSFGPTLIGFAALSPDARHVAFVAGPNGAAPSLWVRAMDQPEARVLSGTERAANPFWSPDGRSVAFVVEGRLLRSDLTGTPQLIARVSGGFEGGSWGSNGIILFGTTRGGVFSVAASGGDPIAVTKPEVDQISHHWPVWLPDQKHFLYRAGRGAVYRGSIAGDPPIRLFDSDAKVEFVPPGTVLFVRGADLMAQEFDVVRNEVRGAPTRIAEQIRVGNFSRASYFSSPTALMYAGAGSGLKIALQVLDPAGRTVRSLPLSQVRGFSLSPDGRSVAVHAHENNTTDGELWIVDIARGSTSRIAAGTLHPDHPVWSPDGKSIAIVQRTGLSIVPAVGSGPGTVLVRNASANPSDWSADGKWIIYHDYSDPERKGDIWAIPAADGGSPRPLVQTADNEFGGVVSPDGRWLAYTSDESGRNEVYLQPFPPDGRKIPVSVGGGSIAVWDGNNRLCYWAADGRVMRSTLRAAGGGIEPGEPEFVLMVPAVSTTFFAESDRVPYALLPNGGFLRVDAPVMSEEPLTVVLNWRSLLPK
jgi:Tol biopolymer transport system component